MRGEFDIVARRATRQHGRISRRQVLAAGIGAKQIDRWVAAGLLVPVHRGVYAVGHRAPSVAARYMAAVLACGTRSVLSHRAAAFAMTLLHGNPPPPEITVPTTADLRRPGIHIHRVGTLHPLDHAVHDRIPITIVPRILLDLAPTTAPTELTRLCHEAWMRHRTTPDQVEACIARNPHKPGAARLRRALGSDVTLSFLEDAFLDLLTAHDLPLPRTNIDHEQDRVDCRWPHLDLTVELVTYRYHATRQGFESDVARRRRSNHLAYTYGDVTERAAATAADLRPLLTSASPTRAPLAYGELTMPLRRAEPQDTRFLVEMARLACTLEDRPLPEPDAADVVALLPTPNAAVIATDEDGSRVGAAWWHVHDPPLLRDSDQRPLPELVMAVVPQARGRGIGTALVDALAAHAATRFSALTLNVHLRNPAARLYTRTGFSVAGAGRGPFGVAMSRPLHPASQPRTSSARPGRRAGRP